MILKSIQIKKTLPNQYPYNTSSFETLNFTAPVTFFTGDNGSGKSSLLRTIKELSNAIDIGQGKIFDTDLKHQFESYYRLSWSAKTQRGFYLQSEDFLNYLLWAERELVYYEEELKGVDERHENKTTLEYQLEYGVHDANRKRMDTITRDIAHASHGEGYLAFFESRLKDNALYLLDEPETPLSFHSQLALLELMDRAIKKGCQFIVCTHSPVLLAYPKAQIFYFDQTIEKTNYQDHPLVSNLKNFLEAPERFMHYLLNQDDADFL